MGHQVYLELAGLIDKQVERDRISKEIAKAEGLAHGAKARLANPSFSDKAPPEVVKKEEEKYAGIIEEHMLSRRNVTYNITERVDAETMPLPHFHIC